MVVTGSTDAGNVTAVLDVASIIVEVKIVLDPGSVLVAVAAWIKLVVHIAEAADCVGNTSGAGIDVSVSVIEIEVADTVVLWPCAFSCPLAVMNTSLPSCRSITLWAWIMTTFINIMGMRIFNAVVIAIGMESKSSCLDEDSWE